MRQPAADARGGELDHQHQHDHAAQERADHAPAAGGDALHEARADAARADDAQRGRVLDVDIKACLLYTSRCV